MTATMFEEVSVQSSVANELRRYNAAAEKVGQLVPEQLAIIYQQKWFKMFVPKAFGGLELSLLDGLRIEESLARIDGSLGWTVTLCSGATMFVGYLQAGVAAPIFANEKVCLGGSGRPGGVAVMKENGYLVSGFWQYATGAPHTTHFTANCFIEENGERLLQADGSPVIRSFFFTREEIELHNDWHTMGLVATAGFSFSVKDLQVSKNRSFIIDSDHAAINQPIYKYPFLQFAEATLAVNTCGMAQHFLQLCEPLFAEREKKLPVRVAAGVSLSSMLPPAKEKLADARKALYAAVDQSWQLQLLQNQPDEKVLADVSSASRALAGIARVLVQQLFPYCGMQAANPGTEINRVWRDIHTASQHSLLTYPVL